MKTKSNGKWALITGASSGLGADFAKQLAERGYHLVLTARRLDRLNELKTKLEASYPIQVQVIGSDLSKPNAPKLLQEEIRSKGIEIDTLINNAGYGVFGELTETPWEKISDMIQVDIIALSHLTKLFADEMKARGEGHILLLSSIGAYQPTPTYAAYAAAKAYVLSFGEALHLELKSSGVKVSVLSPGVTATEFLQVAGQKATFYQRMVMMQSSPVVAAGLRAMFTGVPSVIPGLINRMTIWMSKFLPRSIQAKIAYATMRN